MIDAASVSSARTAAGTASPGSLLDGLPVHPIHPFPGAFRGGRPTGRVPVAPSPVAPSPMA